MIFTTVFHHRGRRGHRGGIKTLCYSVVKQSGETEAWKIKNSVSSVYSVVKSVV